MHFKLKCIVVFLRNRFCTTHQNSALQLKLIWNSFCITHRNCALQTEIHRSVKKSLLYSTVKLNMLKSYAKPKSKEMSQVVLSPPPPPPSPPPSHYPPRPEDNYLQVKANELERIMSLNMHTPFRANDSDKSSREIDFISKTLLVSRKDASSWVGEGGGGGYKGEWKRR